MRRVVTVLATLGLAVAPLTVVAAPAAQAEAPIEIERVWYNPVGADTSAKLNQEYVLLENETNHWRSLTGWVIRDREGHTYRFGKFSLGPDRTVRIHTGRGTNTARDRYWGRTSYVWNNSGDRVTLRNAAGTLIDRCSYAGGGWYKDC